MNPWVLFAVFVAVTLCGVGSLLALTMSRPAVRWLDRQNEWLTTAVIELAQLSSGVV